MAVTPEQYLEWFDKTLPWHREFFLSALKRLEVLEPGSIQEGSKLRALWLQGPNGSSLQLDPPEPSPLLDMDGDIVESWDGVLMAARIAGARFPALVAAQWGVATAVRMLRGKNNLFGVSVAAGAAHSLLIGSVYVSRRACVEALVRELYLPSERWPNANSAQDLAAAVQSVSTRASTVEGYSDKLTAALVKRSLLAVPPKPPEQPKPPKSARKPGPLKIPGMVGPEKTPHEFGFQSGDTHLIVDDRAETMTAYSFDGKKLWQIPALARGQAGDSEFKAKKSDTPPGLWKLVGPVCNDIAKYGRHPASEPADARAYGWIFFPMQGLEGQEALFDRRGIGLHGGGSAAGWPGAWAERQPLYPTHGCCRIWNVELLDRVLPLFKQGTVYLSCYQEAK